MTTAPFDLTGKVAIVTGSGRGLGKAMAEGLASFGASVVVCSRTESEAKATAAEIESSGGTACATTVDTADRSSCEALMEFTVAQYGHIDVLVNNAGIDIIKSAEEYDPEDWNEVLSINLEGYFHCAQLAAQRMLQAGTKGSIIMISSIASQVGVHGLVAYGAAKGGVNQLVRTMAVEWAQRGIRVNGIGGGYFDNIMPGAAAEHDRPEKQQQVVTFTPMGRRGQPDELVGPVVFLASDAASYVTGHVLFVDGGYTAA